MILLKKIWLNKITENTSFFLKDAQSSFMNIYVYTCLFSNIQYVINIVYTKCFIYIFIYSRILKDI